MGKIDRQDGLPGGASEPAREFDAGRGHAVGLAWIGDAVSEEVDRAREALVRKLVGPGKGVIGLRSGDVALGNR